MALRTRLFLALSGLVAALVVGQWWMMTSLSRELDRELDTVALAVSGSVASFFSFDESGGDGSGAHVVMDASEVSERLAEHEAHRALLPDPSELVEVIETGDGENRLQTVVIRREFDVHSEAAVDSGEDDDVEVRRKPGMRWQFETPDSKGHDTGSVRIHIERSPQARFLWLVGPESQARVPLPEGGLDEKMASFRQRMLLGSGLVLLLGLLLSAAVAHRVSAPLRRLATAAEEVGGGALGTQVDESAGDREVRATLGAFNRMSSRLAELDARARQLSALRHLGEIGDVARGLAHTLRNPLNALGLSVDELASRAADPAPDPAASEALAHSARRQIQRMDRGIRSFLVLASPSGSEAASVDVSGLARDVALEALQDGGGKVRVTVHAAAAATLEGVEAELRAVLQALVVNAVEATVESNAEEEVQVRVECDDEPENGSAVRVEVLDRGQGLAEEVRQRLFTPHVSTKANGSGMGLFLAHRLATERYRGGLELRDRDGGGTVAVLTLGDRVDPEDPEREVVS